MRQPRFLRGQPRSRTVAMKRISLLELQVGRMLYPEDIERPLTRGECVSGPRPCPLVGCKHNNYLDINPETGSIKLNFPDKQPEDMDPAKSCTLDIADDFEGEGVTLDDVGKTLNLTRERVRQIEVRAMHRVHAELRKRGDVP